MCLILDANLASRAFGVPTHEDFLAIIDWLTSDKKDGKLVVGGQLATELNKVTAARRFVRALQQAGRARLIPEQEANTEAAKIQGSCLSNDAHVIALARVSGARILCARDKRLHQDFGNPILISNPKGHVYQTQQHVLLLSKFGHTVACRRILQA